ncbi:methylated-DNA--[protein]-cysteine S-methyltransferase [bacterium]|nr:methylated-DNA--[protein]-cysteine S-methyltransferase [bacterium]MDA7905699.1 methylated-DNA--[protein]-cysteine S-methyltransferase [Mariniblastus sp.]MDA7878921.1 methylated-DNA--[protein]-cysteine S-methyltransferase [bacterium]MDA7901543.1 methylated-DNA--[protein]-cysteine S-methyltransferase [bacterium]MDA7904596.1 methylated-DNA--[protein]-cysteine S-methyltransferase [bacterium]
MSQSIHLPGSTLDIFESVIGWFGVLYCGKTVLAIKVGFDDPGQVSRAFQDAGLSDVSSYEPMEQFRIQIRKYLAGEKVNFDSFKIHTSGMTAFQLAVTQACRSISRGETLTYGELAAKVGRQGAARAVGTVMKKNPFPMIVPCHRVVRSSGLGGFSTQGGVGTKRWLLELEGALPKLKKPLLDLLD